MKLRRPEDIGRVEWAKERFHARFHRDVDDCPTCRSVEYERWMQRGGRLLRESADRGDLRSRLDSAKKLADEDRSDSASDE
jgi:hypothetical protein